MLAHHAQHVFDSSTVQCLFWSLTFSLTFYTNRLPRKCWQNPESRRFHSSYKLSMVVSDKPGENQERFVTFRYRQQHRIYIWTGLNSCYLMIVICLIIMLLYLIWATDWHIFFTVSKQIFKRSPFYVWLSSVGTIHLDLKKSSNKIVIYFLFNYEKYAT